MSTTIRLAFLVSVLILPLTTSAAESLPCTAIDFSKEFLAAYPNAVGACHEVRLADNGKKYALFKADFVGITGNEVTVRFKKVTGETVSEVTFALDPTAKVMSGGKAYSYSELKPGQALDVWVPESRYGIAAAPGASDAPIVKKTMH